ncbi:hypothetical protein BDF21DRAFT_398689 [Thamnidium elegans]|nr:hypothetical protein BDF21DRAFT_398689 [Thamnidium elegans]
MSRCALRYLYLRVPRIQRQGQSMVTWERGTEKVVVVVVVVAEETAAVRDFRDGSVLHGQSEGCARELGVGFNKPSTDSNNDIVTNNVITHVGSQIDNVTNKTWSSIVSYRELRNKVVLDFHRQKAKLTEFEEKKTAKKKFNVKKTRRVTKLKHRKSVIDNSIFGPEMKKFFGDVIFKLTLEQ